MKPVKTSQLFTIVAILLCYAMCLVECSAETVTLNFDDIGSGYQPGAIYAAQGVSFTTVDNIPDVVHVGDTITVANLANEIFIESSPNSVSYPHHATERYRSTYDVLLEFSSPVVSVRMATDDSLEPVADIVRLLILSPTGNPDEFTVLAIDECWDDARTAPDNLLQVDLGGEGFSYAVFQCTTEAEYFDDLEFDQVTPPPPYICLVGFSPDPNGEQDVTEFMADETLHIYVKDVDVDPGDPTCSAWAILFQKNKWSFARRSIKVRVDLDPQDDGSFRAAVPLDQFSIGLLEIKLNGNMKNDRTKLMRRSYVVINPLYGVEESEDDDDQDKDRPAKRRMK